MALQGLWFCASAPGKPEFRVMRCLTRPTLPSSDTLWSRQKYPRHPLGCKPTEPSGCSQRVSLTRALRPSIATRSQTVQQSWGWILLARPKELVTLLSAAIYRLLSFLQVGKHLARQLPRVIRYAKPTGPAGVFLVFLGLIGAGIATIRQKIITNVRSCKRCSGYGIQRCSLCDGRGMVGWEGKWSHREPCPMCLGRRFIECTACGGRFHRPLFQHIHTTAATLEAEIKEAEKRSSRVALAD